MKQVCFSGIHFSSWMAVYVPSPVAPGVISEIQPAAAAAEAAEGDKVIIILPLRFAINKSSPEAVIVV